MSEPEAFRLSVGQCAALACLLEATAPKPGNVHRGADFDDLTYVDFAVSAAVVAPIFERAPTRRLGQTVLDAVSATRQAVATNTNLGMLLLMTPLAMAAGPLDRGVCRVLERLDAEDARLVYQAIRLAQPGGLGRVERADVHGPAPTDLVAAMRLAADRDLVARQYANGFSEVLGVVLPVLAQAVARRWPLADVIVYAHLRVLSEFPDTLIARKCGDQVARRAADQAAAVLAAGQPGDEGYGRALADFDFWLRADHHRRNPGATADLLAAGLFAALRDGIIPWPLRFYA